MDKLPGIADAKIPELSASTAVLYRITAEVAKKYHELITLKLELLEKNYTFSGPEITYQSITQTIIEKWKKLLSMCVEKRYDIINANCITYDDVVIDRWWNYTEIIYVEKITEELVARLNQFDKQLTNTLNKYTL